LLGGVVGCGGYGVVGVLLWCIVRGWLGGVGGWGGGAGGGVVGVGGNGASIATHPARTAARECRPRRLKP
jgi:hypothetical protein